MKRGKRTNSKFTNGISRTWSKKGFLFHKIQGTLEESFFEFNPNAADSKKYSKCTESK